MPDLLVKLYDLPNTWDFVSQQSAIGVTIRKPIGPEKHVVIEWVRGTFGGGWASEADAALSNSPATCFVAVKDAKPIGFACYDATVLGFFGPVGVDEPCRGKGTGTALLKACLLDMKLKGYGYAIIGSAGPVEFYRNAVAAIEIEGSSPGVYRDMMRRTPPALE